MVGQAVVSAYEVDDTPTLNDWDIDKRRTVKRKVNDLSTCWTQREDWLIAKVWQGKEIPVHDEFISLGIDCYLPLETCRVRPRRLRQWVDVHRPLYPGYLFIRGSNATRNTELHETSRWFGGYMRNRVGYVFVGNDEIEVVRQFEQQHESEHSIKPSLNLAIKDTAVVVMGPLEGKQVCIQAMVGLRCWVDVLPLLTGRLVQISALTLARV